VADKKIGAGFLLGRLIIVLLLTAGIIQPLCADTKTLERSGDVLLVLMPLSTMGASYYLQDYEGMGEYASSLLVTGAATEGLKNITRKKRPDGSDDQSFPSAHTSATFATASYIHRRYGLEKAIVPYLAASFVGYTRVASKKHYVEDVLAGAVLGTVSSWYLTSENREMRVTPFGGREYLGIEFSVDF